MNNEQVPRLREQLREVRRLLDDTRGEDAEAARAIEAQVVTMLDEHKLRLLEVGAAGRLLISGELDGVWPLEDAEALERARPISPSGAVTVDPVKIEARHDAQVTAALGHGAVAVIVLGGAHDLSASVKRFSGRCEYLRVTTKRFRDVVE